jgi:MtN3 and saliva related transmembrane protein
VSAPSRRDRDHPRRTLQERTMDGPDLVGWIASAILIATLARQTWHQWQDPDPRGLSHWLFIGQIAASVGFIAYSWLLHNWVFIVTNTLILITAVVGQVVFLRAQRKADAKPSR